MSAVKTSKTATKGDAKVTKKEPVVKKEKDTVAKKEPVAKKEKASKKEEVATPVPVKEEEVVVEVAADVTNEVVVADTRSQLLDMRAERDALSKTLIEGQVRLRKLSLSIDKMENTDRKQLEKKIPKGRRNPSSGTKVVKSGLNNKYTLSPILAEVCGLNTTESYNRKFVTNLIYEYIKTNNLRGVMNDVTGKMDNRILIPDDKLNKLFGKLDGHTVFSYFNMNHYTKAHFTKVPSTETA